MKNIKWYHHLFLWLFKNRYIGEFDNESGVWFCYRYKRAFGKVYILDERKTPKTKSFKFPMVD